MKNSSFVFDSSAIIALIQKEEGADIVAKHIRGAIISSVNYSEIVAVLSRKMQKDIITAILTKLIPEIIPFDETQATEAGMLYQKTKHAGLSLGDRACITLAQFRKIPILTADKAWLNLNLAVEIKTIR
jgi:ribonuclease VapC